MDSFQSHEFQRVLHRKNKELGHHSFLPCVSHLAFDLRCSRRLRLFLLTRMETMVESIRFPCPKLCLHKAAFQGFVELWTWDRWEVGLVWCIFFHGDWPLDVWPILACWGRSSHSYEVIWNEEGHERTWCPCPIVWKTKSEVSDLWAWSKIHLRQIWRLRGVCFCWIEECPWFHWNLVVCVWICLWRRGGDNVATLNNGNLLSSCALQVDLMMAAGFNFFHHWIKKKVT